MKKKKKKSSKFGIAKFLVIALVLGGGLIYGTQMVQKSQENRSKATYIVYEADEYGGGTKKDCSKIGGKCGDFNEVPPTSASCKVDSTSGIIYTSKCDGDKTVQCCAPKGNNPTSTPTIKPTTKPSPTPTKAKVRVDGFCSSTKNKCTKGSFKDVVDSKTYYIWQCVGENGGVTRNCKILK